MGWIDEARSQLRHQPVCGYGPGATARTEPTALACLALTHHGELDAARRAADWLAGEQTSDGLVGIDASSGPYWPTSLAILAWIALGEDYRATADKGIAALLGLRGEKVENDGSFGHDSSLIGWPWVVGTHSWLEPTCMSVLALKAGGHTDHPRVREAVQLVADRQLPQGGCNYGNNLVLGQFLLPHLQPSGLALAALAGENQRIAHSLRYVHSAVGPDTTSRSLSWGLIGLAAHDVLPDAASSWLERAHARTLARDASAPALALLLLAAAGAESPLLTLPRGRR